jgi:hypothetical protein
VGPAYRYVGGRQVHHRRGVSEAGLWAVDLDYGYCTEDGTWDETALDRLLAVNDSEVHFVIGAADNQPKFYPKFDLIVLVSAPEEVMIERLRSRTNNPFGKSESDLAKVLDDRRTYEPLIRQRSDYELVTVRPVDDVVQELLEFVGGRKGFYLSRH